MLSPGLSVYSSIDLILNGIGNKFLIHLPPRIGKRSCLDFVMMTFDEKLVVPLTHRLCPEQGRSPFITF